MAATATIQHASARYAQLQNDRNIVLVQARAAVNLTIPGLIPQLGASNPHAIATQPWQNLGARGVNNLAAKLLLSLFPAQRPFFQLEIAPETAKGLGTTLGPAQEALAGISYQAMSLVESSGSRPMWMEAFRHLIVAGNVLVYHPDDGTVMRIWRLDQYVVRRDAQGRMLEAVIEEEVYLSELDEATQNAVGIKPDPTKQPGHPSGETESKVKVYTMILREGDNIIHYQEINDIEVPGSRGQAPADVAGWQALRWQAVPGSDYGRSMVSEYAGDFLSLEEGWQAVIKFAAEAARIIRILDPNSGIDVEELAAAESGDALTGFFDKINTLQLDKNQDFSTLWNVLQSIERRVSQAFLLTANTIRDAERVTAEEIRAVAQELEDSFGGTYTVLSAEAQAPYARRILYILNKLGRAPKLPATVTPQIVTGFAALGQNHESVAIVEWLKELLELFGEQWMGENVNGSEVAARTGTNRGITDVAGMLYSDQQKAQMAQANQNAAVTQSVAPKIAGGAMDLMKNPGAAQAVSEAVNSAQGQQ